MGKVWTGPREAALWILSRGWSWPVVNVVVPLIYGLGVAALFGDEYVVSAILFLVALTWLTTKFVTWEETRKHEHGKLIRFIFLCLGASAFLLSLLIALESTATRFSTEPWTHRGLLVVSGMLLLAFYQRIMRTISNAKTKKFKAVAGDKGYLDYRLQAEEGIHAYTPILGEITNIFAGVGQSLEAHTKKLQGVQNLNARAQVKRVGRVARMYDSYTAKLQDKCDEMEQTGDSIAQGLSGWLKWISTQVDGGKAADEMEGPMRAMAETLKVTQSQTSIYMSMQESCHGVSRQLNEALDAHLIAIKRIWTVNEKIRNSCLEGLEIFQSMREKARA
jgi:hypothetical protein